MALPKTYQSPFHATLTQDEADKALNEADYAIHSRDLPTRRNNSHRTSWELRELSTLNIEASARTSSDSYEPNRLGSQG